MAVNTVAGPDQDHVSFWGAAEIAAAGRVLCKTGHGNRVPEHPPCPKHLAQATYALAAVHKQFELDDDNPYTRKKELFYDHRVMDLGNRTWWIIERRDHHRPDPKPTWWQRRWGKFRMNDYGRRKPSTPEQGELVSSQCTDGWHMPALDLDFQCTLVPSTTLGHYHLYLNRRLPWRRYRRFLRACKRVGIIEPGYYRAAMRRRATYLWRPGYYKRNEEASR